MCERPFSIFVLVLASDKPLAPACSCFCFVLLSCAHFFQYFFLFTRKVCILGMLLHDSFVLVVVSPKYTSVCS